MTRMLSGCPVATSVCLSPASSISTAANTNTTSAMPPAVSAVVSLRGQRLRTTVGERDRHRSGSARSPDRAQPVDDPHRRRAHARARAPRRRRRRARTRSAAPPCARVTSNTGNSVPICAANPSPTGKVSAMPMAAADRRDRERLAENQRGARRPGAKPSALSVAYSASRSRAVIAMVLAITAMMITITTKETIADRDHDRLGLRDEAELERLLGLGERLGERVPEQRVDRVADLAPRDRRRRCRREDRRPGRRAAAAALLHRLVQVVPVEEHLRGVGLRLGAVVDAAHHELPGAGEDRPAQRHHVAHLEAVACRRACARPRRPCGRAGRPRARSGGTRNSGTGRSRCAARPRTAGRSSWAPGRCRRTSWRSVTAVTPSTVRIRSR